MCARKAAAPKRAKPPAGHSLTGLLDQVSDGIVVLDRDWRYVFVNHAGAAMFGRTPDQLVGRHIWTEFPEGVGQPFHQAYERAMATQQPVVIEDHYAPWDRWFENRIYPTPDALTIFYHEITDRKRAESALRDTAQRLQAVIQGTGTGLWDWDLSTDKVRFSDEWKSQIGYAPDEIGDDLDEWTRRVHPDDLEPAVNRVRQYLDARAPSFENEFRFRHKDGSYRWILARAHVVLDRERSPVRLIGIHLDITRRKQEQLWLAEQNAVLEEVARGARPEQILDRLTQAIERVVDGSMASAMVLASDGVHIRHVAAPNLPPAYREAIDGQPIGPQAGSCGTAMFRAQPVVVGDIATDPLWEDYRSVALAADLRSCWSVPIIESSGRVLGSFALYWHEPREPLPEQMRLVSAAAHIAAIAVERSRKDQALRASEAHARRLFDQANDAIHVVSADGRLLDVNLRGLEMLGYTREELIGRKVDDIVPEEDRPRLQQTAGDAEVGRPFVFEWEHVRKDGTRVPVEVSSRRLDDGTYLAIVRDLTERRRAEHALRLSLEQTRRLAAGLERARESERSRIARELHDELGQMLTGLRMDVAWLTKRVPPGDADAQRRITAMTSLIDEAVGVGRRIASELRPGVLDDLGLASALRWLGREFERRSGIHTELAIPEDIPIRDDRATAVFRVAQEAFTNVARHSGATRAMVSATMENGELHLDIADNGRGMAATRTSGETLGILGMRERIIAWGGTLTFRPSVGGGTTVEVRIPLDPAP
jgi:PAS domain S-box-containing protein